MIDHIKFLASVKAVGLNRENSEEVNDFNTVLKTYNELINPKIKKDRKSFEEESKELLESVPDIFADFKKRVKHA